MTERSPRRLRGHKATATCCIASRDRPGLVVTSGEVKSLSIFYSLLGCVGIGKVIEINYGILLGRNLYKYLTLLELSFSPFR
jgi:hypothetical protein